MGGVGALRISGATIGAAVVGGFASDAACVFTEAAANILASADVSVDGGAMGAGAAIATGGDVAAGARSTFGASSRAVEGISFVRVRI